MQKPRFRRSRKDYPQGVIAIYDNGGATIDRYTVCFEPEMTGDQLSPTFSWPFLTMSANPRHPQGVCQHDATIALRVYRCGNEKTINFSDLPQECQAVLNLEANNADND